MLSDAFPCPLARAVSWARNACWELRAQHFLPRATRTPVALQKRRKAAHRASGSRARARERAEADRQSRQSVTNAYPPTPHPCIVRERTFQRRVSPFVLSVVWLLLDVLACRAAWCVEVGRKFGRNVHCRPLRWIGRNDFSQDASRPTPLLQNASRRPKASVPYPARVLPFCSALLCGASRTESIPTLPDTDEW